MSPGVARARQVDGTSVLVKHIQEADRCSVEEAQRQIREALSDGALLVEWEARRPVPAGVPINPYLAGYPWKASKHWLDAQIDWDSSEVLDDFDPAAGPPERARLVVGCDSIFEI